MKIYIFISLMALVAAASAGLVPLRPDYKKGHLGSTDCSRGPAYWCQNITAASGCHAVQYCIRTVWVHQHLPLDTTSVCEICLNVVKEARDQLISNNETQDQIREIIDKACSKLPNSVNETCVDFVNTYEATLVAILAQEIDPSRVCPLIRACPSSDNRDVEKFIQVEDDAMCPLCLLSVTTLETMVGNAPTEEDVTSALDVLCVNLPITMTDECTDFVETNWDELVDMMVASLNPDEICVNMALCADSRLGSQLPPYVYKNVVGNIGTKVRK